MTETPRRERPLVWDNIFVERTFLIYLTSTFCQSAKVNSGVFTLECSPLGEPCNSLYFQMFQVKLKRLLKGLWFVRELDFPHERTNILTRDN